VPPGPGLGKSWFYGTVSAADARYAQSSGAKIAYQVSGTGPRTGQHILFSASRDQAFAKVRLGIDQPAFLI
jgi:hypothetical protein